MAGLKRTPVRPSGAELVAQIASETTDLPPTKREPEPPRQAAPAAAVTPTATATEQINFRGSPELARILARLARLLLDAGHPVPDADLVPPPGRRRL
jgi:hypothetical protein